MRISQHIRLAWSYRQFWARELLVVSLLALVTSLVFTLTDLDIAVQRWFFSPEGDFKWPLERAWPWSWLRDFLAPVPAVIAIAAAFGVLVAGYFRPGLARYRAHCLFVILALILGPGVLVNGIIKERWARPRPRQIENFGGHLVYRPAVVPGPNEGGLSFPCGHSSVAFYLTVFYFLFRRKRRLWAWTALTVSVVFGGLVGLGRMVAGAHFLSDVLWSAYLVFLVSHVLYYFVLNIPAREDGRLPAVAAASGRRWLLCIYAALLLAALLGILAGTPFHQRIWRPAVALPAPPDSLTSVIVRCPRADMEVQFVSGETLDVSGVACGFAFPGSRIVVREIWEKAPKRLTCAIEPRGWFGEYEAELAVRVPAARVGALVVEVERGSVSLGPASARPPPLTIKVQSGRVSLPASWTNYPIQVVAPAEAVTYR